MSRVIDRGVLLLVVAAALAWGGAALADPAEADPDYPAAAARFANGQYAAAATRLIELRKRYPADMRLCLLLGDTYERQGFRAAARACYAAVLAVPPDARSGAVAAEAIARVDRLVRGSTTAPADSPMAPAAELSAEQIVAMSVVAAEPVRKKTDHFDIVANNAPLADAIALAAEAALDRQCKALLGGQMFAHRVEITVYATQADFQKAQCAADWAGGGFLYAPQADGSVRRLIALYQVDDQNRFRTSLLSRELPHELAHVVLREYFGQSTCPLWLEEGLATLAEGDGGRSTWGRASELFARQAATPLAEFVDQPKPPEDRPAAFYIQSASWTRFLRTSLSDVQMRQFLSQIKAGAKPSVALGRVLVVDDRPGWLGVLEDRWHTWAAGKP